MKVCVFFSTDTNFWYRFSELPEQVEESYLLLFDALKAHLHVLRRDVVFGGQKYIIMARDLVLDLQEVLFELFVLGGVCLLVPLPLRCLLLYRAFTPFAIDGDADPYRYKALAVYPGPL